MTAAAARVVALVALLAASATADAQTSALRLTDATSGASLTRHCAFARDPRSAYTARDVFGGAVALEALRADGINEGFSRATLWLRCAVRSGDRSTNTWFIDLGNQVDQTSVYTSVDGGAPRVMHGGRTTSVFGAEVPYLTTLTRVTLSPDASATLVIRARSSAPVVMRPRVWSSATFAARTMIEALAMGLFYGMLLVAAAYNAVLYASTRVRVYRSYAAYVASVALFAAVSDRIVAAFLSPNDASWQATSGVRFGAVMFLASLAFAREYLDTPRLFPRTEALVRPVVVLAAALFASSFVSNAVVFKQAILAAGVSTLLGAFAAAVLALRRGSVEAPWFLIAAGGLMVSFLVRGAVMIGLLPLNTLTEHAWRGGVVVDVAMLSVGLAARVRALRDAHARARAKLAADREAMNAGLEALVRERTRELEGVSHALAEAQRVASHQKRMASLGQLASALAHEVANPLNFTIGGAAELTRRVEALRRALERLDANHGDDGDVAQARAALAGVVRALELVQGGNARIRAVVDSLRAYTRSGEVALEAVDVIEVVRTTLKLMASKLEEQGVTVTVHGDDELPRVRGRVGELCQVFMNLLVNASQAMPDGGAVVVSASVVGARVEVSVADDGPGVALERRSAVFDPYFTTRAAEGGTGLGLSVSHEIARQLGGELRLAESERGATFVLSLLIWTATDGTP